MGNKLHDDRAVDCTKLHDFSRLHDDRVVSCSQLHDRRAVEIAISPSMVQTCLFNGHRRPRSSQAELDHVTMRELLLDAPLSITAEFAGLRYLSAEFETRILVMPPWVILPRFGTILSGHIGLDEPEHLRYSYT